MFTSNYHFYFTNLNLQVIWILDSGRIFTFGANEFGQLGIGSRDPQNKPRCVKGILSNTRTLIWIYLD